MKAAGSHRAVAVLASLAILALGTGVLVGPAAGTSGDGTAETAKKKCKKKKAGAAKKKKCKKKKKKQGANPAPLVRATLTWDTVPTPGGGPTDLDLWVFDSNGNRGNASSNAILSTAFSANDIDGIGPETFTDLIYAKPGRNFSFGVCYRDGGSQHVVFNLDYVTADGVHHTDSQEFGSDGASTSYNGGAPIPDGFCQT